MRLIGGMHEVFSPETVVYNIIISGSVTAKCRLLSEIRNIHNAKSFMLFIYVDLVLYVISVHQQSRAGAYLLPLVE